MTSHRDDRELVAAHVGGDDEAFGVLFARHRDRLWAVALRTTGDPEDAADALQEAMIAAFRRAESYRGDAAVTTWLHRIVVNACLDRIRRRTVRRSEPLPEDHTALPQHEPDPGSAFLRPRSDADPEAAATAAERSRAVHAALATLPADQRAALVLVDMSGYSVEETARILDIAPGTVKSRCSRGRRRLAERLGPILGEEGAGNRHPPPRVPSTTREPEEVNHREQGA